MNELRRITDLDILLMEKRLHDKIDNLTARITKLEKRFPEDSVGSGEAVRICPSCHGTKHGWVDGLPSSFPCATCNGLGYIP